MRPQNFVAGATKCSHKIFGSFCGRFCGRSIFGEVKKIAEFHKKSKLALHLTLNLAVHRSLQDILARFQRYQPSVDGVGAIVDSLVDLAHDLF